MKEPSSCQKNRVFTFSAVTITLWFTNNHYTFNDWIPQSLGDSL